MRCCFAAGGGPGSRHLWCLTCGRIVIPLCCCNCLRRYSRSSGGQTRAMVLLLLLLFCMPSVFPGFPLHGVLHLRTPCSFGLMPRCHMVALGNRRRVNVGVGTVSLCFTNGLLWPLATCGALAVVAVLFRIDSPMSFVATREQAAGKRWQCCCCRFCFTVGGPGLHEGLHAIQEHAAHTRIRRALCVCRYAVRRAAWPWRQLSLALLAVWRRATAEALAASRSLHRRRGYSNP